MRCFFPIIALALGFAPLAHADDYRTWTDTSGKFSVSAKLEGVKDGRARLTTPEGKTVSIPLGKLSQEDRDVIHERQLAAKRAMHQTWSTKVVGTRMVVKDDPTSYIHAAHGNYGASAGTTHHYYQATERVNTRQAFVGSLLAYDGHYATIKVKVFGPRGNQTGAYDQQFNVNNLSADDQRFLAEYRKLEKAE